MRTQKDSCLWTRNWALTRQHTESVGALVLDSPASRTVRNIVLIFINHPNYDILFEQPEQIKTELKCVTFQSHSRLRCGTSGFQVVTLPPVFGGQGAWTFASGSAVRAQLPSTRSVPALSVLYIWFGWQMYFENKNCPTINKLQTEEYESFSRLTKLDVGGRSYVFLFFKISCKYVWQNPSLEM